MSGIGDPGAIARRAALASVATAGFLLVLKGWAASATGSIAMLGSLADTALDLVASLVTLLSIRIAAAPADGDHRFGHGKAEALAALFQVALIAVSATAIAVRAVGALFGGARVHAAGQGILVSAVAAVATLALLAYQRRALAAAPSLAIRADSLHYESDLIVNSLVIVALLLDREAGIAGADAVLGVAVALWLGYGAWRAAMLAIDQLMDREWPEPRRRRFLEIAGRHPELRGIHDLRTRTSGARDFVQFHVWVAPEMSVADAHRVMDEVEQRLEREFPGVEVLIHPDPEGHVDPVTPAAHETPASLSAAGAA